MNKPPCLEEVITDDLKLIEYRRELIEQFWVSGAEDGCGVASLAERIAGAYLSREDAIKRVGEVHAPDHINMTLDLTHDG